MLLRFISSSRTLFLLAGLLLLVACSEDDCIGSDQTIEELRTSDSTLFADAVELNEGRGLYYIIDDPGIGPERPSATSTVTVNYTGTTTERDTFDQTSGSPVTFQLDDLITGWQLGLPLIGEGGRIRLFVPSTLAYGPNEAANLCPNSDLIFDIELVSFE